MFCSKACKYAFFNKKIMIPCAQCGKPLMKPLSEFRKSKTGNMFCSISCATTLNNYTFKKKLRSSTLEKYIQEQMELDFPTLKVVFNDNSTIKAELDIFIPSLNVAIEIHGPFHYRHIRGKANKLDQMRVNDARKAKRCKDQGIRLYALNASEYRGLTKKAKARYYPQIKKLIEQLLESNKK